MKIAFYGGCHSEIICRIFVKFSKLKEKDCKYFKNYELIAEGFPINSKTFEQFDTIVMSPIFNHGEYNTDILVEDLKRNGKKVVIYPWLQWNGYFPNITPRAKCYGSSRWRYEPLNQAAIDCPEITHLSNVFNETMHWQNAIDNSELSLGHLRHFEELGNADIRISQYIVENYKKVRLFCTPDHPSNILYAEVAKRIAALIGVDLDIEALDAEDYPFQPELNLPISPAVKEIMGLEFELEDRVVDVIRITIGCDMNDYFATYLYDFGDNQLAKIVNSNAVVYAFDSHNSKIKLHLDATDWLIFSPISDDGDFIKAKPLHFGLDNNKTIEIYSKDENRTTLKNISEIILDKKMLIL